MAEITRTTEPRPSFLFAVLFIGLASQIATAKGWIDDWGSGQVLWLMAVGWLTARSWYLGGKTKNLGDTVVDRETEQG
jgi:hypothetical protein